jgi:hypothetical protein
VVAVAELGSRLPSVFRWIIGESTAPQAREAFPSAGGFYNTIGVDVFRGFALQQDIFKHMVQIQIKDMCIS